MSAISILLKPSSGLCNMSCDYCFYRDETQKRDHPSYGFMTEDTLKHVIQKTLHEAAGPVSFAYQGGEPALRGLDFFEKAMFYQKQYNVNRVPVSNAFQTNGCFITEDWCRFFKQNDVLVGLSIDGTADIHNKYRKTREGKPTYKHILEGTALLDQYQVDYNILTVVTRDTAANIREIYQDYRKRGFQYQQYIACLDPFGEPHNQSSWSLTPRQYGQFLIDLFALWYDDLLSGQQPFIRQFENYIAIAARYMPESCEHRGICGLQYVVEADGSVYPCDFYAMDSYRLGNFNEDTLTLMDRQRSNIQFIQRSRNLDDACRHCAYYALCRGGCQRNRDFDPGTNTYRNYFCESYRMFFEVWQNKILEIASCL